MINLMVKMMGKSYAYEKGRSMNVIVKEDEYYGKKILKIHEVKDGEESEKPVVQFGFKKAKAIVAAFDKIKEFVKSQS